MYNAIEGEGTASYKLGKSYLVFASGTSDRLSTASCSQGCVILYPQATREVQNLNRLARRR